MAYHVCDKTGCNVQDDTVKCYEALGTVVHLCPLHNDDYLAYVTSRIVTYHNDLIDWLENYIDTSMRDIGTSEPNVQDKNDLKDNYGFADKDLDKSLYTCDKCNPTATDKTRMDNEIIVVVDKECVLCSAHINVYESQKSVKENSAKNDIQNYIDNL